MRTTDKRLLATAEAGELAGRLLEFRPPLDLEDRARLASLEREGIEARRQLEIVRTPS